MESITKELTIRDRINHIFSEKNTTSYKEAMKYSDDPKEVESFRVKISNQLNGKIGISLSTVQWVLDIFPDVSAEWLVRNDGPMYVKDIKDWKIYTQGGDVINASGGSSVNTGAQTESPTNTNKNDDTTLRELLDIEREHYREIVRDKDKIIADKDKIIADKDDDIKQLRLEKNDLSTKFNMLLIKGR